MEIIKFNTNFDFTRLTLDNPEPLQSSTYFTKIKQRTKAKDPTSAVEWRRAHNNLLTIQRECKMP